MKKKAFITGVTGQDGAYLSEFLLHKGYQVHGLKRRSSLFNTERIDHLYQDPHIENQNFVLHYGDMTDSTNLIRLIKEIEPDEIYNLAAQSSVNISFQQPLSTMQFNCMSTLNLLEIIRILDQGTKFLLPVSSEMYGHNLELPINENSIIKPTSPYAISKAMGYWTVINYRKAYKLYASNAILFNHESYLRNENFFIKKVIKNAILIKKGVKKSLVLGNLDVKRDFGYAPEYVKALWLILNASEADDYIICSGMSISLKEIVEYIFEKLNLSNKLIIQDQNLIRPVEILDSYGDNSKIKNKNHELFGLNFKNKLGTAAGLDKNGDFIDCLGGLGFGFLEVGTVTPLPQTGNPKPRVFRLFKEQAVINRLGFNNKGVDHLVKNLKKRSFDGVVGVNIGANKSSEDQKRIDDYLFCFKKVYKLADYIVINISSPNTHSLRELHDEDNLSDLLSQIASLSLDMGNTKPIFLKVSPDETNETIERIVGEIKEFNFSGLIATNTTIDKKLLKNSHYHSYKGGLSGAPLLAKSNETIKCIRSIDEKVPLIGVGGVMTKDDFDDKLNSGANLIQVYTGFILKGPSIINELLD